MIEYLERVWYSIVRSVDYIIGYFENIGGVWKDYFDECCSGSGFLCGAVMVILIFMATTYCDEDESFWKKLWGFIKTLAMVSLIGSVSNPILSGAILSLVCYLDYSDKRRGALFLGVATYMVLPLMNSGRMNFNYFVSIAIGGVILGGVCLLQTYIKRFSLCWLLFGAYYIATLVFSSSMDLGYVFGYVIRQGQFRMNIVFYIVILVVSFVFGQFVFKGDGKKMMQGRKG